MLIGLLFAYLQPMGPSFGQEAWKLARKLNGFFYTSSGTKHRLGHFLVVVQFIYRPNWAQISCLTTKKRLNLCFSTAWMLVTQVYSSGLDRGFVDITI